MELCKATDRRLHHQRAALVDEAWRKAFDDLVIGFLEHVIEDALREDQVAQVFLPLRRGLLALLRAWCCSLKCCNCVIMG